MGKRIDYFDDPAAPPANSVKPSATAFVLRDGAVLLTCRSDNGNWSMPGGAHDPGESLSMTAVRETKEDTSNDEVRQEFTVVYRADYVSGEPTPSSETTIVKWVPVADIEALRMDRSQRMRIQWAVNETGTWIDP